MADVSQKMHHPQVTAVWRSLQGHWPVIMQTISMQPNCTTADNSILFPFYSHTTGYFGENLVHSA